MKKTIRLFFAASYFLVFFPQMPLLHAQMSSRSENAAIVSTNKKALEEKENKLKKAISLNSKDPVPYIQLALFYRSLHRSEDARTVYLQILAFDGENAEPYYGIGQLSYEEGKYLEALKLFNVAVQKYLEQNSSLVYDAFYYRGLCYYYLGDDKNALKNLQYACAYYADNAEILSLIDSLSTKTGGAK